MTSVELASVEYGRPPLFILHGVFGSARNWSSIAQRLAAARRVIALDARNHGASPWANAMTYADMTADLRAIQEARGLERVALLGHSMGGKTAMLYALQRPKTVERLIVVDVAPAVYPPNLVSYVRAMQALDLGGLTRRSDADRLLADAIESPAERAFLLQNLVFEEGGARWRLNLRVLERAMPDIAGFPEVAPGASYPGPALFVAGARSSYCGPEHEATIKRLFPKAEIIRIPDVGHWLHAERPEEFLKLVLPFVADGG